MDGPACSPFFMLMDSDATEDSQKIAGGGWWGEGGVHSPDLYLCPSKADGTSSWENSQLISKHVGGRASVGTVYVLKSRLSVGETLVKFCH